MMKLLEHISGAVSTRVEIIKGLYQLFKMEAALARLNMVPLMLCLAVVLTLLLSFWLTILCLAGYLFMLWTEQPLLSLGLVEFTTSIDKKAK